MKHFKIKNIFSYMVVATLVMALSISCKNEGTTGSGNIVDHTNQNYKPQGIYTNGFYQSYAEVKNNGSYCSIIGKAYYSQQVSVNFDITVINWYQEMGITLLTLVVAVEMEKRLLIDPLQIISKFHIIQVMGRCV